MKPFRQILSLLLLLPFCTGAQNLVLNPDFESVKGCPGNPQKTSKIRNWEFQENTATLHLCGDLWSDKYVEWAGPQGEKIPLPFSGFSFAGMKSKGELTGSLSQPTEAGVPYALQFHVRRADGAEPVGDDFKITLGDKVSEAPIKAEPAWNESQWYTLSMSFLEAESFQQFSITFIGKGTLYLDDVWIDPVASVTFYGTKDYKSLYSRDYSHRLPNWNLEGKSGCPENREEMNLCQHWITGRNTPDYFHTCGRDGQAGPVNELGQQPPHSGNAYAGFWATVGPVENLEEYLRVDLMDELKDGQAYQVRLYVSLADVCTHAIESIQLKFIRPRKLAPETMTLSLSEGTWLDQKGRWMCLEQIYVAKGGEYQMFVGNFTPSDKTKHKKVWKGKADFVPAAFRKSAYYYIDDVMILAPLNAFREDSIPPKEFPIVKKDTLPEIETDTLPKKINFDDIEIGKTLILDAVLFDFGSSRLRKSSFAQLNKISNWLTDNQGFKVTIEGHTDNVGTASDNLTLSANRAESVKAYLIRKGVDENRISAVGFGESKPITSNDTPEGRQMNRRVTCTLQPR